MEVYYGRAGLFRFVFVMLLVLFNWPVLSIPGPQSLLLWLFVAWGASIVLLWAAARSVSRSEGRGVAGPSSPWAPPVFPASSAPSALSEPSAGPAPSGNQPSDRAAGQGSAGDV